MLRLGWFLLCTFGFLGVAQANEYPLREDGADIFGQVERIRTRYEDTLIQIARRYSLGYEELLRVNQGVDPWLPGEGTEVLIPGQRLLPPGEREGIVVNLPEHRLYYFPKPKKDEPATVLTYPVSVGKMDWRTPIGSTKIEAGLRPNRCMKSVVAWASRHYRLSFRPVATTHWVPMPCALRSRVAPISFMAPTIRMPWVWR